ncbi:unnamed protein product [Phytomonas sp. EM1]|nr:unnamed protein product [Phytomonas sp. EM1]|eukprot:CCW64741.1 unnamed protein product [Phytomonas sp. isolate EM1]
MSDFNEEDMSSVSSGLGEEGPQADVVYPLNVETAVPGCHEGLFKTLLVEGHGARPVSGAKVIVHYVGRLESDGSVFDSSRERGEPFEFTLGKGQVIKGWDKGVATMRIGETAVLKCYADYAYGAAGSPPKIPGNATLLFEVELLGWTREEDISEKKDRSLMKRTLTEGVDYANPEFESEVVVDVAVYSGAFSPENEDEMTAVWEKQEWRLVLGDTTLPPFFEECLKSMRKGESAIFRIASALVPQAHPEFGIPAAEARENADVSYDVTLRELKTIPTWGLAASERIAQGSLRIDKGNAAFQKGDLALAERFYRRAQEFLGDFFGPDEEGEAEWQKTRIRAMGNLSQVLLMTGNHGEAITICKNIISMNPSEKKALFRMAKALNIRQDWDEALEALDRILREDPDNADAKALRMQVSNERRAYNQKQKSLFKKMFS